MEGADDLGFCIDSLSATDISRQMLAREKVSLNTIANDSTYGLIQKLIDAGVKVQEVYVDTVGNAATYEAKLSQRFPGIKFTVAPKVRRRSTPPFQCTPKTSSCSHMHVNTYARTIRYTGRLPVPYRIRCVHRRQGEP